MSKSEIEQYFLQKNVPYISPFYSINFENDDDVLTWIKDTDNKLSGYYQPLFREQKNNLKIFLSTGVNPNFFSPSVAVYLQQGMVDDEPDEIHINEMYLLVMQQISTVVSNELTSQVLPNNDDYQDKIASKFVKMWLDSMSYDLDIDLQRVRWEIQKKIFGEAFVIPVWNPDIGDIHPAVKDLEEDSVDLVDEEGNKVRDDSGKVVKISKYQRVGDIELINPMPFDVMIDPKNKYSKSNWFYWIEYEETEYLKKKYPDLEIGDSKDTKKYDSTYGMNMGAESFTKVYHFYHRSHEFLHEGRHLICSESKVLLNQSLKDLPTLIDTQDLPLVRFTDLDIGFGVRGTPILFRNARNIVGGYNRLTNQIYKNLEAESPKIMIHETAGVDAQRMESGVVVMEWRGNIKPTIETPTTNTNSIFKFREDLKKNIMEAGMQTPMVRGDTPNAQLDSFIALQHFEDQRVQLAAPDIKGHVKSIEHLYRYMILIAKDHYDQEDQRLIKIVGRNNKYNLKFFNPENLNKVYDVKITTTGNLANSKAARTQLIMTLKREFPNLMSDEVFIDMLGLSSSDKFQNSITVAVNSAEAENEDMLNGVQTEAPERYEDLITHWDTHRIPIQSQEYKLAPPNIKELFERHLTATEKLMYDQMAESPVFASRIQGLRQFPMFYSPLPTNDMPDETEEAQGEVAYEDAQPQPDQVTEQNININREGEQPLPEEQEPERPDNFALSEPS